MSNAIKFTPQGGTIEVSLETGRRERAGNVLVCVKDSGPGIAPEDLKRLLRYFVQAGPVDRRAEGSGLGLALARSMVELQGGEMWAESNPGRGACFYFTLPVHVALKKAPSEPPVPNAGHVDQVAGDGLLLPPGRAAGARQSGVK